MTSPKTHKNKGAFNAHRTAVKTSLRTLLHSKGADFFDEDGVEENLGAK
jgi:hypothetical protein